MAILVVFGAIGTTAFYVVELIERRKAVNDGSKEMIKSSDENFVPS